MRAALVQSDAGSNSRALDTARALRAQGHDVTLVVPQTKLQPALPSNALAWQAEGFAWIPASAGHLAPEQRYFPRDAALVTAHALADIVQPFDIVWFFEAAWAMPLLRERRFSLKQLPIVVLDERGASDKIPSSLAEINQNFARRYARQWADRLFTTPSDNAHESLDQRIQQVAALWQYRHNEPAKSMRSSLTTPAVTVCIPYYEEPQYLQAALQSLAEQTSTDFSVVVVDDGSHSDTARAALTACRDRYAHRGWTFISQSNAGAGSARNTAAQQASTEFLIFLDADDVLMPNAVEAFLRGALITGDDCLVARNYGFRDDPNGPCTLLYDPPGNSLIGSMGDDMHGGSCMIFRREAFLQLGGFTEIRGVGFEDYELHVRANLQGLRWDVLPDLIYRYREPRSAGVSRSTSQYPNLARVTRWYRERLQPHGLGQLPLAFASTYWSNESANDEIDGIKRVLAPLHAKRSPLGRELKLLLLTCNFPFGLVSGWHMRVQHMIRYFGSRYQLTLITSMPREELAPSRKQTFEHLHAVLGVEGSNTTAVTDMSTPFRVREHYTDVFQRAIQSIPTDQYHAAIMDQVFMAEFRKDIDTLTVLTEHNIESRLLYQASERAWTDSLPLHYQNALTEAQLLERYEDQAWADFPLRVAVSKVDRDEMERRVPKGKIVVVSNGADLSTWLPNARFEAQTVLFAGHLAYLPNVDGVEFLLSEIWQLVRKQKPHARLILAGRDPSPVVRAAVERAETNAGIELCHSPVSMDAVAARASITVAPLRLGSGTRCKILDSMAWGLPVVSTTLGAEGIDVVDGEHLLIRDDPAEFAAAIVQLLSNAELWKKFRTTSHQLVRERYSWERVFNPMDDALRELIP